MYLPQNVNNDRYFLCKLFITDFEWEDDNNKIGKVKGGLCALSRFRNTFHLHTWYVNDC